MHTDMLEYYVHLECTRKVTSGSVSEERPRTLTIKSNLVMDTVRCAKTHLKIKGSSLFHANYEMQSNSFT